MSDLLNNNDDHCGVAFDGDLRVYRSAGIGDVLMCTPALREFKRINPWCRIQFYTALPALVQGLPYLDVVTLATSRPSRAIWMEYEHHIPSDKHLATIMGESIGIRVSDVQPDCVVDEELVEYYKSAWRQLERPYVLVHRLASSWTPNKDWPTNYWENLVLSLSKTCSVIEIGRLGPDRRISNLPNYIDLRGAMDIRELVACVKAADILVSSDSGPVHIAAAVRTPAVVIFGGYIIPKNIDYQGNTILYSPMHCSPCLLRIPCPINMECLRRIQPDAVEQAITLAWDKWKQDQID